MLEGLLSKITDHRARIRDIRASAGKLASIQPGQGKWSVNDCLVHMSLATELYLDQIEKKLHMLKPEKSACKPTFLANYFISALAPQKNNGIKFKMKTMKKFDPLVEDNLTEEEPAARLLRNLERLEKIIGACSGKDLRSFRVTTALGPILRFYIGDALRFICAHNDRHLVQIGNIMSSAQVRAASNAQEQSR